MGAEASGMTSTGCAETQSTIWNGIQTVSEREENYKYKPADKFTNLPRVALQAEVQIYECVCEIAFANPGVVCERLPWLAGEKSLFLWREISLLS